MSYLNPLVLDNGVQYLKDHANRLHICSAEPADYAGTLTVSLGTKNTPAVSVPGDRAPSGRKVTISAITDGAVSANGDASHWALVDTVNSRLLAAKALDAVLAVNNGDTFTLPAFDIGIPGPA
ncbi:hypothetical protein EOA37_09715 [Mesorhizobium sp. M2A.F.Ca.ET.015.02.1.1]|uniref:hypothetical protein n=1 Tax=Mesorhizobium sp. M2A.F.Ca.ET.015.02.1.1 TaxID=2496758 RepID=UPI000FCC29ED|nr:hypothetical protein [Mesorhizobium sp. M2A.F.Ca.ET.015.02.1.1]RUW41528.1 hypothetical protein EOA37_09715 [Mesorhizobium sp. M2A.F.Ca.ET.015.02.1.1]